MDYQQKYLKYKQKYFKLKNIYYNQKGGSIFADDNTVENLIAKQNINTNTNININIKNQSTPLINLLVTDIQYFLTLINTSLIPTNELGTGQYGTVYNLSPKYALKRIKIMQNNVIGKIINAENDILTEIRIGYYVEYLNTQCDLFSGNLSHFNDGTYYYIIMKKFDEIGKLDNTHIIINNTIIDVAISLISQLFLIVLTLSTNNMNHGDEKFDNLLFENTRTNGIDKFTYNIGSQSYYVKNCGFKLKLIDWGQAGNISSTGPQWDAGWISNFELGVNNKKKDRSDPISWGAPTSDYLVNLSKILKLLGFLKNFNEFKQIYLSTFNEMYIKKNIYDSKMELFKYNILIGDDTNNETLLKDITPRKIEIPHIYNIFKTFYNSKNNNFFIDDNDNNIKNQYITPFSEFNHYNFPRVSYSLTGDLIEWKICDPRSSEPNAQINQIKYTDFIKNITKYLDINSSKYNFRKIDSSIKPPVSYKTIQEICASTTLKIQTNSGNLISGITNNYIFKNINNKDINDDLKILKIKLDNSFNTNININNKSIDPIQKIYFGFDNDYLYVIEKKIPNYNIHVFKHTGLNLKKNAEIDTNHIILYNYGGLCISDEKSIKDTFNHVVTIAKNNKIMLDLSPLGFFHYHLNYNSTLDMFFGVIHAKIEITTELNYSLLGRDGYMNKKIKKQSESTIHDLTGNVDTLRSEHNYIFSIDRTNNFKLYHPNCDSILHSGIGLNDNFFNTDKFAEINFYGDVNGKSFVFIYNTAGNINNIDYTNYNRCIKTTNYTQAEINEFTTALHKENYKKLRQNSIITHLQAKEVIRQRKDIDQYIGLRNISMSHKDALPLS